MFDDEETVLEEIAVVEEIAPSAARARARILADMGASRERGGSGSGMAAWVV